MVVKFEVDLDKPIVFQVGYLGEDYDEWVHKPIITKEGPRLFANHTLELLTRTRWWVIPVIWLPIVSWLVSVSVHRGLTCAQATTAIAFGIFTWSLLEYTLHRFLFHVKTQTYWTNTLHYLLHGCHHKHPMDALRLVFPPAAAAILAVPIWSLIRLLSTASIAPALFGGVLLGYIVYDITHYYLHHGQPNTRIPKNLKKYHLNHHFRIHTKGFGITSSFWDHVFGTYPHPKVMS